MGAQAVKKDGRFLYVDALNVVAAFAVVLLHSSLQVFSPVYSRSWFLAVVAQAIGIFAVPVFFMISGMNLLGYRRRYGTAVFFRRRLARVGVNLLFASIVVYAVFWLFPGWFYGAQPIADNAGPLDFLKRFLTNSICDVYWFLYAIIYLYMLTPLLSLVAPHKRLMEYLLAVTLGISVGIPLLCACGLPAAYVETLFNWPLFASISLLYFCMGFYIKAYGLPRWFDRPSVLLALLLGAVALMVFLGLWSNTVGEGHAALGLFSVVELLAHGPSESLYLGANYNSYWISITSPLCVLQSICVFCLFKHLEEWLRRRGDCFRAVLARLSAASLYIYLFHMLFILFLLPQPLEGALRVVNAVPFLKAPVVFALTAIAVVAVQTLCGVVRRRLRCLPRR